MCRRLHHSLTVKDAGSTEPDLDISDSLGWGVRHEKQKCPPDFRGELIYTPKNGVLSDYGKNQVERSRISLASSSRANRQHRSTVWTEVPTISATSRLMA